MQMKIKRAFVCILDCPPLLPGAAAEPLASDGHTY